MSACIGIFRRKIYQPNPNKSILTVLYTDTNIVYNIHILKEGNALITSFRISGRIGVVCVVGRFFFARARVCVCMWRHLVIRSSIRLFPCRSHSPGLVSLFDKSLLFRYSHKYLPVRPLRQIVRPILSVHLALFFYILCPPVAHLFSPWVSIIIIPHRVIVHRHDVCALRRITNERLKQYQTFAIHSRHNLLIVCSNFGWWHDAKRV